MKDNKSTSKQKKLYNNALKYFKFGEKFEEKRKFVEQQPNINNLKAIECLRRSADLGYAPAQNKLGRMYQFSEINDYEKPRKLKRFLQEDFDKKFERNSKKAVKLYKASAKQGYAPAQKSLGLLFMHGTGVEKNPSIGMQWLEKAAEQDHIDAWFFIAQAYNRGWGGKKNHIEAAKWFERAAVKGHSYAQGGLGWLYEKGLGVKKDYKAALRWYLSAAKQGHPGSCWGLGTMYEKGLGVERNINKALYWFRKTSVQGVCDLDIKALLHIGKMYELGIGMKKNFTAARKWYKKAVEKSKIFHSKLHMQTLEAMKKIRNKT